MAAFRVMTLVSLLVVTCDSLNIVETAQATDDVSVLVEAVVAAGLAETLSGTGPFTVFAPTNAAFTAALTRLSITKKALLARTDLADILKFHVLSGKIMAADLVASQTPATLAGATALIEKSDAGVTFGGAKVTTADVSCSNGVIHIIETMGTGCPLWALLPASTAGGTTGEAVSSLAASKNVAAVAVSVAMMVLA